MGGAFDLRHRGAGALVREAVELGRDWLVSRAEHAPGRLYAPGSRGGRLLERRGQERTLRVRHELRVGVGHVGAEDVVEARWVDRQLDTTIGQRPWLEEVAHRERRIARLQVGDRLALVGHESGHIHQPGDLVRRAGDGDYATAV